MVIMLSTSASNGSRLAEIIPTLFNHLDGSAAQKLKSAIVIVVDGLGWFNLNARSGHARTLLSLQAERINTVVPSTTAAALTTLTTGSLPGAHGMVGYRINHPKYGLLSLLSDLDDIKNVREVQLQSTEFEIQDREATTVFARSTHATSGLTRAILTGAAYVGADSIEKRFELATKFVSNNSGLIYLYVDELDRAGHKHGWESSNWVAVLERIDQEVQKLLDQLPKNVSLVLTADHGMVDIPVANHIALEDFSALQGQIDCVAGEPRFRHIFLRDPAASSEIAMNMHAEGPNIATFTKKELIDSGIFGEVSEEVSARIGDVIATPQDLSALTSVYDGPHPFVMIGQHGGLTEEERAIPLISYSSSSER